MVRRQRLTRMGRGMERVMEMEKRERVMEMPMDRKIGRVRKGPKK
jgi:hypothetical protein